MKTKVIPIVATLLATHVASAKNVDLSTVPDRATVQLTIYNSEDITLVRETRKLSFKKGHNPLQFSWANTLIDPTSVELRFLSHGDDLEVLDSTFPHDKRQMLYWNVESDFNGAATVEISYFTSGISWSADYVAISDTSGDEMTLSSFVRVQNNSGEPYDNAQIRLVVGKINLVEKIARLAQVPVTQVAKMPAASKAQFRQRAARSMVGAAEMDLANSGGLPQARKQVVKQGLSEYFIYTIQGTETVPNGWSKRLRSFAADDVPFRVKYRFRPAEYGNQLVRLFLFKNNKKSELGTTPLPDGIVRIYRDNGRDGLSYLGAQPIKYVPIGDEVELNLGVDKNVIFELVRLKAWRDSITFYNGRVSGWDEHVTYAQRIRNYTGKAIDVEVRRLFSGHATFRSRLHARSYDYRTVEFTGRVSASGKRDFEYQLTTRNGRNAKQSNLTLISGDLRR